MTEHGSVQSQRRNRPAETRVVAPIDRCDAIIRFIDNALRDAGIDAGAALGTRPPEAFGLGPRIGVELADPDVPTW